MTDTLTEGVIEPPTSAFEDMILTETGGAGRTLYAENPLALLAELGKTIERIDGKRATIHFSGPISAENAEKAGAPEYADKYSAVIVWTVDEAKADAARKAVGEIQAMINKVKGA